MELMLQDVITTGVALGAATVLIVRLKNTFFSGRPAKPCDSCPGCETREHPSVSSQART
jgi:hypothetical protein